jgi:AcrR family transcriptional regulator
MGRPRVHDDATRAALLAAAGRIVAEEGPGALSLRRLSRAVDASTQVIYTLFGAKDGLIRAMHREGFATLDRRLGAVAPDDDPAVHLRALMLAYRESALAQPHLYDVMFACPFPEFVPSDEDQELALGTLERLRATLNDHVRAGALAGHDPEQLTLQIWAMVHGLASLELQGALGEPEAAEAIWTSAIDTTLAGLCGRADPRRERSVRS